MSIPNWSCILFVGLLYGSSLSAAAPLQFNVGLAPFSKQLSQPTITSIHKDGNGFLWIGTQSGLNRYDGSKLTIFDSNNRSKNWVPASDISQIAEDSNNTIWIATYGGGIAKYSEHNNTFEAIHQGSRNEYLFPKSILVSKDNNIWFGTRDAGIGMYNPSLRRYASWLAQSNIVKKMGQVSDILEDDKGNIWASGKDGLYLIDPKAKSIISYHLPITTKPMASLLTVTAIEHGPSNTIWIGTSAGDLLNFDTASGTYSEYSSPLNLPMRWITDIVYKSGKLWIATDEGLMSVELELGTFKSITRSNSSLSTNVIFCLLLDQRSMFIGTALGLNILSQSSFQKYQSDNSKVSDDVTSFAENSDGSIWIGTFDGVYQLESKNQMHTPLESIYKTAMLNDRRVTTMAVKDGEIWLGFFRGGVQIIDLNDGASRQLELPNTSDLAITSIIHASNNSTWLGTYNQGLYQVIGDDIISYLHADSGEILPEVAIMSTLETSTNRILVSGETRLYQIDSFSRKISSLKFVFQGDVIESVIQSIAQSIDGDIWIGIKDQGLFIWNYQPDSTDEIQLELAKGSSQIPSSTIYAIEFDSDGYAWISTTNGITKLNSKGEFVKNFKVSDGLQGSDFNFSASFRDSKGRLYFGGSNGYNRFDPSRKAIKASPPPVVLTGISITGTEPQLPVAMHKLEVIELAHEDYFVTFSFSVLDYADPDNNRFRYKLESFDPEWIENGTRNTATYTNLPPGIYTFLVQGASSAGIWNLDGTSIKLVVHPARWLSWQAYLIYMMLLAALIQLAKEYYDNIVLRKKAAAMAQEMHYAADRAADDLQEQLEYQDEFVKSVHAHSVTTLELIADFINHQSNSFSDDLTREAILSNSYRVNALALLEGCLLYQGDKLLANMEDFTNAVIDQLLNETPELALSTITINEMPSILIPAELATPLAIVLFELLRNCFQHAFENSTNANYIQIRMEEVTNDTQGYSLKLSVQDNGVGIPDNISPDSVETSGLAIVSSIANRINGTLSLSGVSGTLVTLIFPGPTDTI